VEREGLSQKGIERSEDSKPKGDWLMISLERWPKVKELREKLNGKAKAEPGFRFYLLYDKVCRKDFLEAAYAQCRSNGGAPGVDRKTFEDIEKYGKERYLAELADELKERRYEPQPVRRVLIPKVGQPGKFRPLGIPTIKDRVVQQSVKLLLEAIFEADFTDDAYGYRAGKSAHDAINRVNTTLRSGQVEVVDADLSKYFDTIPHDELMQAVERRIADRKVLWLIRSWLKVPVHETNERGRVVITGGKKTKQGTPQGGVISPLLANIYFRRFLVAWEKLGLRERFESNVINYADDFVILCRRNARGAMHAARQILQRIGLTLNEEKTRVCRAWNESFNFLGYTFGKLHTRNGRAYLGQRPSEKSVLKYRETVRQLTAADQTSKQVRTVAAALNRVTRGYWNYFSLGTTARLRQDLDRYLWERMRIWAERKHRHPRKRKGHKPARGPRLWERVKEAQGLVLYSKALPNPYRP
jgi:RNA-directed DNA polymerase